MKLKFNEETKTKTIGFLTILIGLWLVLYFIPEVFDVFEKEYKKSNLFYRAFIDSKDLGLIANITNANEKDYGKGIHSDYYKIVDEKKWLLAKIKYGI
jgi:hypothetical protein